ncbi:hypothetical protein RFI_10792 [Reticulomyxa filosa]|uniref:Uncharacterized protein n=1 Tax=Reticulomyxa filosa TaxID=46433 RepID=X6NK49_RETFI|nr:hypothetical protein RFI_10792 [Reticulomyxa filosa]|eukprot:ETO26346.1 hypothetical protein RFI_10792 [Reticulomyxa filosa]
MSVCNFCCCCFVCCFQQCGLDVENEATKKRPRDIDDDEDDNDDDDNNNNNNNNNNNDNNNNSKQKKIALTNISTDLDHPNKSNMVLLNQNKGKNSKNVIQDNFGQIKNDVSLHQKRMRSVIQQYRSDKKQPLAVGDLTTAQDGHMANPLHQVHGQKPDDHARISMPTDPNALMTPKSETDEPAIPWFRSLSQSVHEKAIKLFLIDIESFCFENDDVIDDVNDTLRHHSPYVQNFWDALNVRWVEHRTSTQLKQLLTGTEERMDCLVQQLFAKIDQQCLVYLLCPKVCENVVSALLHKLNLHQFFRNILGRDSKLVLSCQNNTNLIILELIKQYKDTLHCEHDNVLYVSCELETLQHLKSIGTCNVYPFQKETGLTYLDCEQIVSKFFPSLVSDVASNDKEKQSKTHGKALSFFIFFLFFDNFFKLHICIVDGGYCLCFILFVVLLALLCFVLFCFAFV